MLFEVHSLFALSLSFTILVHDMMRSVEALTIFDFFSYILRDCLLLVDFNCSYNLFQRYHFVQYLP
jgi:hypothetical protein